MDTLSTVYTMYSMDIVDTMDTLSTMYTLSIVSNMYTLSTLDSMDNVDNVSNYLLSLPVEKIVAMDKILDKGNGSFVLNISDEPEAEKPVEQPAPTPTDGVRPAERRKPARASKPAHGVESGNAVNRILFDAVSASAFRTAKMVYEKSVGKATTNSQFLMLLLDGGWESIPPATRRVFKDILSLSKGK